MLATENTIPTWALSAKNDAFTQIRYQHLVGNLRRRLQSAIERQDLRLVRELESELQLLEREL